MIGSSARAAVLALLLAGCGGAAPEVRGGTASAAPSVDAPAAAAARPAASSGAANPIFAPILPRLRAEAGVPLRLPAVLGWEDEPPDSAFAIVEKAGPAGYELIIGLASDCDGGNWCRYGSVSAARTAGAEAFPAGMSVALADGIAGHFVDATCGAVCGDSRLWWEEDGVRYSVGVKAGSVATLTAVARSALAPR